MRHLHDLFLDAMNEERERTASRRRFLSGAAKLSAGGALALTAVAAGPAALRMQSAIAAPRDDIDVLNYALTLEHLEYAFYRDGLRRFGNQVPRLFFDILEHEKAHVDTLTAIIRNLGGRPVQEGCYDFNYERGVRVFKETAQALENTGVSAYDGAIASITTPRLQTAGATIATVEARHASYLNTINGDNPFPDAFDKPLTKQQVLDIAGQFIVDCR